MEDKKGILYKGVCLCGNIVFEFFREIQENIFANKAILLLLAKTLLHRKQFESDLVHLNQT